MITWNDVTGYRQGQRDREPNAWSAKIGGLKVSVVKDHIYNPGYWSMSCAPWFDVKNLDLPSWVEADEAKREALLFVRAKIKSINEQLETI